MKEHLTLSLEEFSELLKKNKSRRDFLPHSGIPLCFVWLNKYNHPQYSGPKSLKVGGRSVV